MLITTIAVAVLALVGGVVANRYLHARAVSEDETEGLSVKDLVSPMQTMTILLLAFVLAMASSSHGKADEAARNEAGVVDSMQETAEYAPKPQRERLQADMICYARAVQHEEWSALADGEGSSVPSVWSRDLRATFKELVDAGPSFGMLTAADKERSKARETRIAESTPAIPNTIYWFMLATLTVTLVALGLCLPRKDNRPQLAALLVVAVLLTSALLIIRDIERPFSGWVKVTPSAMADSEEQATREFRKAYGTDRLPCDEDGRKKA